MKDFKIYIIGSGFMGQEIGKYFVEKGYPVTLKGRKTSDINSFLEDTTKTLSKLKRKGKISEADYDKQIANTKGTLVIDSQIADADLVIESVLENIEVKRELFKEIEKLASIKTLFATNTSALSVSEIAKDLKIKDRIFGLHFFHPVKYINAIEVVRGVDTSDSAINFAYNFCKEIDKRFLPVKDSPAFFLNRVGLSMLHDVYCALGSGWYTCEDIKTMFNNSDFVLDPILNTDATGLDIIKYCMVRLENSFPERFTVPPILDVLINKGRLGRKVGKGFYNFEIGGKADDEMNGILNSYKSARDENKPFQISAESCKYAMMNEAIFCIEEGIVNMDEVENFSAVFPSFSKGLFKYMDSLGLDNVYNKLLEFQKTHGERFKPAGYLKNLIDQGKTGSSSGEGFYKY